MPIIATETHDALVVAVRSICGRRRLPRGARVVEAVCGPDELQALAAKVHHGWPVHSGPAPASRLGALRDALEDAVSAALGDVEVRSEIELRSAWPGACGDRGPVREPAGWRTAVRFTLLVDVPYGTAWTVHAPGRDVTVDRPGSLVVSGPDLPSTWRCPATSTPVITCSARTLLRG